MEVDEETIKKFGRDMRYVKMALTVLALTSLLNAFLTLT